MGLLAWFGLVLGGFNYEPLLRYLEDFPLPNYALFFNKGKHLQVDKSDVLIVGI